MNIIEPLDCNFGTMPCILSSSNIQMNRVTCKVVYEKNMQCLSRLNKSGVGETISSFYQGQISNQGQT